MNFPLFEYFKNQKLFEEWGVRKDELIDSHLNKFIMRDVLRWLLLSSNFQKSIFGKNDFALVV